MNLINTFILWFWILCISLVLPVSLPAGGAQKSIIENRENSFKYPLIALRGFNLLSGVSEKSSILTRVKAGTPVKVIKVWYISDTNKWLLVNVISENNYQFFAKRGWVNIAIS